MSNLVPQSTFRSKYISLSAAALLACFAIALAVLPSRSAEAVSSGNLRQIHDSAGNSGTIAEKNFIEPLNLFNPPVPDVLAAWSFESVTIAGTATTPTITGSAAADSGVLTAGSSFTGLHASASTIWSNFAGNASAKSFSADHWAIGDYYQFSFSTSGNSAISMTWDQTGSSTGPRDFKVQYSTNGTTFTDASGTNSTYAVTAQSWSSGGSPQLASRRTLDLSGVSALANQSTIYIRLVVTSTTSIGGGTIGTGGTQRLDNFTVNGTAQGGTPTPTPTPSVSPTTTPTPTPTPTPTATPTPGIPGSVVVSQVYGGGGCGTAGCSTYKNDYIELFNRSGANVSLSGWSVQYASATGTGSWSVTNLTGVTLAPGQYYLVQESGNANGVNDLPAPDVSDTTAMAAGAGKVLVASTTTTFTGACPSGVNLIDLVGYGSTANCSETSPAPAPSTTTADLRAGDGCTDTDNNSADFSAGAPNPRNTASPTNKCVVPIVTSCPGSLSTVQGNATSASVSASDADGTVTSAVITSAAVPGISLDSFTPASGTGGTATATLNVANTTAAGSYNVTIQYSNNDTPTPQTATCTVFVSVYPTPAPFNSAIKISQVYGGGGNSGSTYTNDFIELYNTSGAPVDISGWSVQFTGPTAAFAAQTTTSPPTPLTTIIPAGSIVQPGHYFLIQESQGAGGTTSNPAPDLTGGILVGSTAGKVALVASATVLSGTCPTDPLIVDFLGYNTTATCAETTPIAPLVNTTAAIRKNNGCTDTNNNSTDFLIDGPIPRNSLLPAHGCGGDPTQLFGQGIATPDYLLPSSNTLLTVNVSPASAPPSTSIAVSADLTSIGGNATQQFYDDGTHGDQTAGDNVFSYLQTVGPFISTGVKNIVATITDAQTRSATAPITITVQSPTCGVERWSVKTGGDPDAALVDLNNPVTTTIANLRSLTPPVTPPDNARVAPAEDTVYVIRATMTLYKLETDVDYHIVVQDENGNTMVTEIPCPCCVAGGSPFAAGIANARQEFDAHLTATTFFQSVSIPVQITGVGFFDFIHGQTGVAPNGIELHPILDIRFLSNTTTTVTSNANPSQYGQPVTFTATVASSGASIPTGNVTFSDGATVISSSALNGSGQAAFTTSSLSVGSHSITASYPGDSNSLPSTSTVLTQVVNKADQFITFAPLAGKTYGDGDFGVSATASSGLPVGFSIASGPATILGSTVHITGAGTVMVRASQGGNGNYNPAPDVDQSFEVVKAEQAIVFAALSDKTYGDSSFTVSATGGGSGNAVTFNASGNCTSGGLNGSTITITGAGSCTVTASQAGNANYYAAPDVPRSFTINQAAATINVSGYTGVYDGNAHGATGSATGVNAEDLTSLLNLGGTFTNVPGGTAHWVFAGNTNYAPASGNATITITKATPVITWNNPADIVYGTALGATQLNATANVLGSFNYTPGSGTVLSAGAGQPLLASFTPTDTTNYNPASKNVQINVLKATPSFSNLSSPLITYGTPSTNLSGKLSFGSLIPTGSVAITLNSVTQNAAIQSGGNFSSSFATGSLAPAAYTIAYSYAGDGNFNSASGSGTLTVGYGIVVLYDQTKVHQSGSTIPIKLEITGSNGNNLSSAGTVVTAVGISLVSTSVYGPVEDSGSANPDSNFKFTVDSYTYNLQTTGLTTGVYNLYFTVGTDPTLHTVQFQIK
jgi:hypothetical protein